MSAAAPWRWIDTVQTCFLVLGGLGLFGSMVPAFFAIIAPDDFTAWLWWFWLLMPGVMVFLIASSAAVARRSRPVAALALLTPAAVLGLAIIYYVTTVSLA